ncbi:MAG: cytochrome c maturation protein CcmE [Bacteroidales bacterium]|nr:cytochrome c maturation protein CcmE [Bacteroidales bacterium]
MKGTHIVTILFLVAIIAIVITTMTNSGAYSNFAEAAAKPGRELHIIGALDHIKPIEYDALKNANQFSFFMTDEKGIQKKVVCKSAKPHDFEKSEKVVIIGSMQGEQFVAKSLLLKCPSKYDEKKPVKFGDRKFGSNF